MAACPESRKAEASGKWGEAAAGSLCWSLSSLRPPRTHFLSSPGTCTFVPVLDMREEKTERAAGKEVTKVGTVFMGPWFPE